jgi:hypothetical protein
MVDFGKVEERGKADMARAVRKEMELASRQYWLRRDQIIAIANALRFEATAMELLNVKTRDGHCRRKCAASPIHCSKNGTTRHHGPDAERDSLRSPWLQIPFYKRRGFLRNSAHVWGRFVKQRIEKSTC